MGVDLKHVENILRNMVVLNKRNFKLFIVNRNFRVQYSFSKINPKLIEELQQKVKILCKPNEFVQNEEKILSTPVFNEDVLLGYVFLVTNYQVANKCLFQAIIELYSLLFIEQMTLPLDRKTTFEKYNLTYREKEAANKVLIGKKDKSIARDMYISTSTVRKHLNNIYLKCGVTNKLEFVCMYYRRLLNEEEVTYIEEII